MRKKFMAATMTAALLAVTLLGAGCSQKAETPTTAASEAPEAAADAADGTEAATEAAETEITEPVTIKFANYALLEQGYEEFWNNVKSGFEAENPNITIEYVTAP